MLMKMTESIDTQGRQCIIDTACGSDVISTARLEDYHLWPRKTDSRHTFRLLMMEHRARGCLREHCRVQGEREVLSIGRRCMHEGCHLV